MGTLKGAGLALAAALLVANGCSGDAGSASDSQNNSSEKSEEEPKKEEAKEEPEADKGSRENPLPLGEASTAIPDWEVSVADVNLDATSELVDDENLLNEPPQTDGGVYVTISIKGTFLGGNATEGNPGFDLTTAIVGNDSKQYTDTDNTALAADALFDVPTLEAGGEFEGSFVVDIPADALDGSHLFLSSLLGGEEVYWQLPTG